MALKKRTVVSPAAGAVSLPSLMADLPGTAAGGGSAGQALPCPGCLEHAPLPDDKLLELIESIRANDLHPIVVWKQPDGALMITLRPQPRAGLTLPCWKRPARTNIAASLPPC